VSVGSSFGVHVSGSTLVRCAVRRVLDNRLPSRRKKLSSDNKSPNPYKPSPLPILGIGSFPAMCVSDFVVLHRRNGHRVAPFAGLAQSHLSKVDVSNCAVAGSCVRMGDASDSRIRWL
jgi:hypothetical protein